MKSALVLVSALLVVVLVVGGGGAPPPLLQQAAAQQAAKPAPDKVTLMFGIDGTYAGFLASFHKGFFQKYNIDAGYKVWEDGNVALDAILTGDSDGGATSELGILTRRAKGGKFYVVARTTGSRNMTCAITKGDISYPKDLEGKKVGTPAGSGAHYYLARYMRKYGLDQSKIRVLHLSIADSLAAFRRGDIDVAFIWEPWVTRTVQEIPGSKILACSNDDNVYVHTHYLMFNQRLIDNKELGGRVLRGVIDGSVWVKDHIDEASEIMAKAFHASVPIAKSQIERHDWGNVRFGPEMRKALEEASEFLKETKLIKETPDMDQFLHPEILKAVAPERVTVK